MKCRVDCEQDYVNLIVSLLDEFECIERVEQFLGVEFGIHYEGEVYFPRDYDDIDPALFDTIEGMDVDFSCYTKETAHTEEPYLPESYPCTVVYFFETEKDRFGEFSVQLVEFVYPTELKG